MDWSNLKSCLKNLGILGSWCFGLLSLLSFSWTSKYLILPLGSSHFLHLYNLLVPFSIFFLGFNVWSISQHLDDLKKSQANSRTKNPSSNWAAEIFKKSEDEVTKLREEIEKERELRALAEMELEKERVAASSAADEAMAKIMQLQNEKWLIEVEARRYREMAELKQAYDEKIIDYLKWIIESSRRGNRHGKVD